MKAIARTSESASAEPKVQCTFSKVQQKIVARKKKLATFLMSVHSPGV